MSLEYILLGMLKKPATGYELKAEFESGARFFWSAELAQIYPTLQSLEKRDWLKSSRAPPAKGPPRRIYRRTAKGTRALHDWMRAGPIMGVERFAYIAQLIFHGELSDLTRTREFIEQLGKKQHELYAYLEMAVNELKSLLPTGPETYDETFHSYLCLELGMHAISARIAWCSKAIDLVDRRRLIQSKSKPRPSQAIKE